MSVFDGKLNAYPLISVDKFTKETFSCTAFFLSHCHQDHMDGIISKAFLDFLKSRKKIRIYCSETTKNLMQGDVQLRKLIPRVEGIPINQPILLQLPDSNLNQSSPLLVTLIPAGHCVGSVMFFFEGPRGAVLYTGDFRIKKGDIKRIQCLQTNNIVKEISELYIDTTFCTPTIPWLPSREESKMAIITLMESWLANGENNVVFIQCSAKYGYEYLLKEVAIQFNTKIHVDSHKHLYAAIPGMAEFVTACRGETRIHACYSKDSCSQSGFPCGLSRIGGKPLKIMKIKPSTLWVFKEKSLPRENFRFDERNDVYRVVHSMHSSFEEICDVVSYLQPNYLFPTVAPVDADDVIHAYERLCGLLNNDAKRNVTKIVGSNKKARGRMDFHIPWRRDVSPLEARPCDSGLGLVDESCFNRVSSAKRKRKSKLDHTRRLLSD